MDSAYTRLRYQYLVCKATSLRFSWSLLNCFAWDVQVHRKYTGEDFDEDLRTVLRRSGCKNEKIAFIMDESNVLDSGFLERMNTLLANGEVTDCHCDESLEKIQI